MLINFFFNFEFETKLIYLFFLSEEELNLCNNLNQVDYKID